MHYVDVMSPNHLASAKLFEEGEDMLGVCELKGGVVRITWLLHGANQKIVIQS